MSCVGVLSAGVVNGIQQVVVVVVGVRQLAEPEIDSIRNLLLVECRVVRGQDAQPIPHALQSVQVLLVHNLLRIGVIQSIRGIDVHSAGS